MPFGELYKIFVKKSFNEKLSMEPLKKRVLVGKLKLNLLTYKRFFII